MSVLFTSESVSAGHPDKVCDAISDALLDLHLQKDTKARTAIETLATTDQVIIAGETSSSSLPTDEEIELAIRQVVKNIGYEQVGFSWKTLKINNLLHRQSADIALGVDRSGAGDQGIMFGYAKKKKDLQRNICRCRYFWRTEFCRNFRGFACKIYKIALVLTPKVRSR